MNTSTQSARGGLTGRLGAIVSFVLVLGLMYTLGMANAHAAPAAGTVIGNQATATYNDAGGTGRTATSNLVTTTVSQVKTFTLTADGARTAAPGQTVYYPHTITNTGNGTDTYTLNAIGTGGLFTHTSLAYYIDANGDGVPDNATPIATTGPLAAGGIFRFVVAGTVPAGAAIGATGTMAPSVSDTSGGGAVTNTDTTTVASSVITVTKSLSSNSGASPAGPLTVTLSYTNSGNAAATSVQLTDGLPLGMTYVAGSGRWSVSGATALTDANDGTEQAGSFPPGIDFRSAGGTITALIPSVPAGVSGTVTFQVNIAANLAPQTINNTAQYQTATQASSNTNAASYTVVQTASTVANGSAASSVNGTGEPVTVAAAGAGSTITFNDYVWNRGNGTDTFDVTVTANTFPAGSTVTLLQQDGVSSLLNSGGAAAPDTGPVPGPGAACAAPLVSDGTYCGYKVVVRVTLPASATGGPFSVTLTATSAFDNTKSDTVIDTLTAVTSNTVDMTNNTARTDSTPAGSAAAGNSATTGFGATGATVIVTNNVTPTGAGSTTTRFQLFVNNGGAVNDNFNLAATLAASSNGSVTPPTLPAGWSVQFFADGGAGNCSSLGASISSTGTLNAGANRLVCAQVTVPSTTSGTAYAGNFDFDFTATSTTNAAVTDSIRDRVTVAAVRNITLAPNNTQQTFPGGSVTYLHTITNSGNAADTVTFGASCLTDSRSGSGWTSAAYIDTNANGTLEIGTDTLIACGSTTLPLAVGQSVTIIVRVFAPPSATAADPANVTTITGTYGAFTTSATDSTTVTDGLVLLKEQVAVSCAAAGPHAGYTTGAIPAGPATAPGQCIAYRITGTNTTAGTITNVAISDIVPANTKMKFSCSGNAAANPTVTIGAMAGSSAADGATGTVTANVGPLTSTQAAVLYFCVRIDP
ncbi:MAG TPA: hypothetical protein VFE23_20805 [Usitatibacter sp.]|nr:hypothetical protein [Usitatibacter sp.]